MRQRTPYRRIGVEDVGSLRQLNDLLVLGVRDAGAYRNAHIDNALHVSHANISAVLTTTAKAQPILIYCYHGNASQEYAEIFSDFGFSEVYSLDGGYEAWRTGRGPIASAP